MCCGCKKETLYALSMFTLPHKSYARNTTFFLDISWKLTSRHFIVKYAWLTLVSVPLITLIVFILDIGERKRILPVLQQN